MSSPYQDVRRWKDDIPLFDFLTISSSTNNFSSDNIVGKGGFGDVYKVWIYTLYALNIYRSRA